MAKIVYNTEIRKGGYEWAADEELTEKLIEWDPLKRKASATARAAIRKTRNANPDKKIHLVPVDTSPTAQMTIKQMETDTWISFYRVAEKTKIGTKNPLPDEEIKAELLKFFKKHGIGNSEAIGFDWLKRDLLIINDLFLARDEGDMKEVFRLLEECGLQSDTQFNKDHSVHWFFLLKASFSLNSENRLDMVIQCVSFFDFILYDFLFSKGLLQRWFTCKHCLEDFQWDRKKDYCSPKCKRRAAYDRQKIKGRNK
tara:strand:- start:2870 stop:3634 length:765 start_codon:yes stop_codon:yes gene_type:complete